MTVRQIVERVPVGQSTVSAHLKAHCCIEAKGALAMQRRERRDSSDTSEIDTNRTSEGLSVRFWACDRRSSGGPIAQCNSALVIALTCRTVHQRVEVDAAGGVLSPVIHNRSVRDLIITIPGISMGVADVIIAETGADVSRFTTAGYLASWAGTCPGSNEFAGRIKSTRTQPGNPYLKGALGVAAMSAARSKDTYLSVKYRRIASRRGPVRAIVAVEHAMLIAI